VKIVRLTPYVLEEKLPVEHQFSFSQAHVDKRTVMIVRVETDEGITGWGEAFGPAFVNKAIIEHVYGPAIIGLDPTATDVIWERLYGILRDHGQRGVTIEAISAIDIALWDITAKANGVPLYKQMGGAFRTEIIPYATGLYRRCNGETEPLADEAQRYCEAGYRGIKIKIGFGFEYDLRLVQAIRERVGDQIRLMVDANHGYNASQAILLSRELQHFDISWFEEPVPPEDLRGYREVRLRSEIPVSGGETESTRYGFHRWLEDAAVDILQPDLGVCGGISEFKKIVTLASTYNTQCLPHVWGSGILLNTAVHCCFNLPNFPDSLEPAPVLLEWDNTRNIFRECLSKYVTELVDGVVHLPDRPGHGAEIDEGIIKRYQVG
jgi:D-galactarolactone cycloisomerase